MTDALATTDAPTERASGVWDYISPSRLNLWLRCPLAFKLRYIDGIVPPTSRNLFLGKMVHLGLETFYRHRQLGVELELDAIATSIRSAWDDVAHEDNVGSGSTADESNLQRQAVDLVAAYLRHVDLDNEGPPLAVEACLDAPLIDPSTGEDLGIPLLGVIDLVVDSGDGPLVADFKTTARGGNPLPVLHEIQLTSYAFLFRHASQQEEAALEIRSIVKTKTPGVEFHRHPARTDVHFRRLFAVVRAYLDDLDSGRFVFRPGLGCNMCDFRETHCSDWSGV